MGTPALTEIFPPTERSRDKVWPSAADAEFLSEERLKDAAVELALQGAPSKDALAHIEAAYQVKEECVKDQYLPELRQIEEALQKVRERMAQEKLALEENRLRVERLRRERANLSEKGQQLRLNVYVTVQEIRKKRLENERELFKSEETKLRNDLNDSYADAVAGLDTQINFARKLYELERERWEINKPEYERRIGELTKEKERVEAELDDVRDSVKHMRSIGITRNTAGFLIWSGYASLAGVGGVVANLLSGKSLGGGGIDYISLTFQYLTNIVRALQTTQTLADFWRNVLWPATFVLIILGLTGCLIWLVDRLLQKFDGGWHEDIGKRLKEGRRLRQRGQGRAGNSEGGDARGQSPFLTPGINRMSIPLPEVNRKSYVKLLALLPYLFLTFVIVLLSTGGAGGGGAATTPTTTTPTTTTPAATPPPGATDTAPTPTPAETPAATPAGLGGSTAALSMTYIGIVFALLTVSVFMLYATMVIEPRWRRMSAGAAAQPPNSTPPGPTRAQARVSMYLRAHWEFLIIVCAMILALVVAACLPTGNYRAHAIWSAVAVFMCFSSMALAYGIIQRGIFRSEDYLDGKRDIYRRLIEKYSTAPTLVDALELIDPDKVKGIIDNYRQTRQNLDEFRMLYELKRHFADNYMDDKDLLTYWSSLKKWANPLSFLNSFTPKRFEPTEPELLDYEIAPEETRAVNLYKEEQLHVRSKLEELAADVTRAERDISENRGGLRDLEAQMLARERRMLELKQSYEQERARLRVEREASCLKFKAAYSVGAKVADFIGGW